MVMGNGILLFVFRTTKIVIVMHDGQILVERDMAATKRQKCYESEQKRG
jgi:hypothetical protein